jgi:hypothetical protein
VSERSERRNAEARARLRPLAPGERPRILVVAAAVAAALAGLNILLTLLADDVESGQLMFTVAQAVVLLVVAVGMWSRSYLAVIAFQALLAFQILNFSLYALLGSRLLAQLLFGAAVFALGWLFWKLVPTLARLQMPDR